MFVISNSTERLKCVFAEQGHSRLNQFFTSVGTREDINCVMNVSILKGINTYAVLALWLEK